MTLNGERPRALALLARSPNGRTETFMLFRGCTRQHLDGLIRAGLASATKEWVGRGRQIEITRIKLTEAGRATLSKRYAPVVPQRIRNDGKPPRTKVNGKVRVNGTEKRPALLAEIMTFSPPPAGCERRARLILRKFALNELQVLVKALRDGIANDLNLAFPRVCDGAQVASPDPNGGMSDSLDEAKVAFRAA